MSSTDNETQQSDPFDFITTETREWVARNKAKMTPDQHIGIACYGDHDLGPFRHFISNIVPDGGTDSLLDLLAADYATKNKKIAKRIKVDNIRHIVAFIVSSIEETSKDSTPYTGWCDNVRLIHGHLCIKFAVGGINYVVVNGYSRASYISVAKELKTDEKWKTNHCVMCTYYLKSKEEIDRDIYEYDHEKFAKEEGTWHPGCANDFMAVAYVTPDQYQNFWNSLI